MQNKTLRLRLFEDLLNMDPALIATGTDLIVGELIYNRLLRHEWQSSQDLLREFGIALSRTIDPIGLHNILTVELARRLRLQSVAPRRPRSRP